MTRLEGPLPAWDFARARGDVTPVADWCLGELRARGVTVSRLDELHRAVTSAQALELSRALTFAAAARPARSLVHRLVRDALPSLPWSTLAIQTIPHVRVLVPGDELSPVPPHTDHGIGHGLDERNLWLALTDARGDAALHGACFAESMALDLARRRNGDGLFDRALPLPPIEASRGELLLFTPLHVHGARTVTADTTRVSIDVRIAPLEAVRARGALTFVALELP